MRGYRHVALFASYFASRREWRKWWIYWGVHDAHVSFTPRDIWSNYMYNAFSIIRLRQPPREKCDRLRLEHGGVSWFVIIWACRHVFPDSHRHEVFEDVTTKGVWSRRFSRLCPEMNIQVLEKLLMRHMLFWCAILEYLNGMPGYAISARGEYWLRTWGCRFNSSILE